MTKIKIVLSVQGGFKDSRGGWRRDASVVEDIAGEDLLEALSKPRRLTRIMKKAMAELRGDETVEGKHIEAWEES